MSSCYRNVFAPGLTMECATCGSTNPAGKRFCGDCGALLALTCPCCGSVNPPGKKFCGDCGARLAAVGTAAPSDAPTAATPPRTAEAERRQLTVMFCDLVGSTELAGRLDPEDMREVIRAYHACCTEVIEGFDGFIAKFMGDGVLAYFGYPHAHEEDAERAVRAGRGIVEAIRRIDLPNAVQLQVRVGIATGLVVVGDLIGQGAAQEQAVVGETPNLAARLQELAGPGSVVISRRTRRLIGGLFELDDLGVRSIKGFVEPIQAWRVLDEGRAESRFEALRGKGLTPLVGREHELGMLLERFERAKDGEGQVVLLSGEPGIGKSRIIRALRERLDGERPMWLCHYCSPYHRNSVLHPIIGLLERAAGLERDEQPEQQVRKLEALLSLGTEDLKEAVPLVAALLSVPVGEPYELPAMTPQRQKQRTLELLIDQVEGLARRQPVLLLYEDVHWIDPTSLEAVGMVVDRVQHLPALAIITFRPEFAPPWTGYPHVTVLSLSRLTRRHGAAMVERVTGGKALPPEVMDQIVAKTDGVPLFVEELTKAVIESGLLDDRGDRFALTRPLPALAIPATLHDSLMARLGRLAPVKEVAQIGAAIGREFSHELIAAVAPLAEDELREALDQLLAAELIFRRGRPPDAIYTFKHALVQDAAYDTLLRGRRQQLHAWIGEVLEEKFAETVETAPELLAHHFTQAGLTERAVAYWLRAGQRALASAAIAEAIAHLSRGLELVPDLSDTARREHLELDLQLALGSAYVAVAGFSAPEVGAAYARARDLCEALGDLRQLFAVLYGLCLFHLYRSELNAARAPAMQLLQAAEREDDRDLLFFAHRAMGVACLPRGSFTSGRKHLDRALELYDPERHRLPSFVYAFDPQVICLDYLARALFALGYPEQALARNREALSQARELAHQNSVALPLFYGCMLHQVLGDRQQVQDGAAELIAIATQEGFRFWLAGGTVLQGWATADAGQPDAGIAQMRDAIEAWRETGAEYLVPYFLALMADAHHKQGDAARALQLLDEALARADRTEERWFEPELHRLKGEFLWSWQDGAAAEACLRQAIEVARGQEARLWELRAATILHSIQAEQGGTSEVGAALASLYAWFTEGFALAPLARARALLHHSSAPKPLIGS
jgi:class 3 adenylate cyclase/predicted ATPase